jgi:hypothetical protein
MKEFAFGILMATWLNVIFIGARQADPPRRSLYEATLDRIRFDALMSRCTTVEMP